MFFLFYSLNTAGLKAKEITVISDSEDFYQMGLKTEFIADKGGTLNFEAAINAKDYKKSEKVVPNFGFTKDVYWFKSSFLVSESSQKPWYLVIGYPLLDYVNIYFILPDGTKIIKKVGDRLPFSHREYKNRKFLFSLSQFPKGQEIKVYFKVKTSSSMQFPISIAYEKTFVEKDRDETLMAGLINGSLFIMMFYNLFIFLTTKDRSYINLVIFILGSIGFETGITGWSFQYLWPNLVLWGNINVPFFGSIVNYGALSVAINLTNSENDSPKLTKILKVGYKIALFNAVLSLLIPYKFAIQIIVIYGLPSILLCFTAGFIGLKNKYKPAKIYLFSWSAFLLGTAIIILSKLGFLPSNFVTENGMFIGMVLQALLLSFALAQTINILQSEKDQAEKESTMRLEEQVTILKEINNTTANLCSNHELLEMLKSAAQDLVEILSLKRASIYLISDKFPEELNYMVHSGADPLKTFKTGVCLFPSGFMLFC